MSELLTCEGLTKSYQKGTNALDSIDLHIGFGRIVGLLGPNGSGKTTLIKLANGLLQPTAGSIKVAGMAPGPDTKAIVSYLPDAQWLPDWMRVEQLVEMFRDFYADFDTAKASEMLEKLELSPKAILKSLSPQRPVRCWKSWSFRPKPSSKASRRETRRRSSSSSP